MKQEDLRPQVRDEGASLCSLPWTTSDRPSYRLVHLPTVGSLTEAGFEILPTFRRPHFTLLLSSDTELDLRRLLNALGSPQVNPYHGPRRR